MSHTITDYILQHTQLAKLQPEMHQMPPGFQMFNTGSVEMEVGELLYSLVRLAKPDHILETGTHFGISTLYMALALEENKRGTVHTYEIISSILDQAIQLWRDLEIMHRISPCLESSLTTSNYPPEIDLLFLDSEPGYRFAELNRFWPHLKTGGLVLIHDLDKTLGHHGQTYHDTYDWPYGYYKDKIGHLLESGELKLLNPLTPRGLTIGQKVDDSFAIKSYK